MMTVLQMCCVVIHIGMLVGCHLVLSAVLMYQSAVQDCVLIWFNSFMLMPTVMIISLTVCRGIVVW